MATVKPIKDDMVPDQIDDELALEVEDVADAAGEQIVEVRAPRRPLLAAGGFGVLLHNLTFLIVGVVLTTVGLVWVLAVDTQTSAKQARYVERASQMLMLSQRIAKEAGEATEGETTAFKPLKEARDTLATALKVLAEGDPGVGIEPTPAALQPTLKSVQELWAPTQENVDLVLANESALVAMRDHVAAVNEISPLLLARADEVVEALAAAGAKPQALNLAGRQRTLSQRITKDVNVFAMGEAGAAVAATQFGKDARLFAETSKQLRVGATPAVRAKLDEMDSVFEELSTQLSGIQAKVAEFFVARRASQFVSEKSNPLLAATDSLVQAYSGLSPQMGALKLGPWVLGALAGLFFAQLYRTVVGEARDRAQVSAEQNRQTQESILKLLDEMGDLADGDLRIQPEVTDQMTGAIADSINFAVKEMRGLVQRINQTSQEVTRASERTRDTAEQLTLASTQQAEQITGTTEQVQSMARSMEDMAMTAKQSAVVAHSSVDVAKRGAEAVRDTVTGMNEMREQIQETAKRIKRLGESSQQISEIVGLIDDIAEQTNILSLNAAIQAAMAGEAGRGFAVVADEVQRLAERSAEATKQIGELVKTIQTDTNEAITSMEQATHGVVEGTRLADAAGQSLGEIESVSIQLAELIESMALAAYEQSQTATSVSGRMNEIRDVTHSTSTGVRQTADSIGRLSELARELQASVAGFKLPG